MILNKKFTQFIKFDKIKNEKSKFSFSNMLFFISILGGFSPDEDVIYDDTLTKRLFHINKAYKKKSFESTTYTIQIFYGSLYRARSMYSDFKNRYSETSAVLIFETPNYKVRVGKYKDINVASQALEKIRKIYPGSFIIKLSNL